MTENPANHSTAAATLPSDPFDPVALETHWQHYWKQIKLDRTPDLKDPRPPFYALSMFPYPSGSLHMGHVRNYVITDVIARVQRMRGYAVLHPMGWDAFGLPAENAAIERGTDPAEWTSYNIKQMRSQLNQLGLSIDWQREQTTCSENYYRWTQWLFLELFEAGLAYQKEATVNWDPVDQTVLANEQVDSGGRSWRSGAMVEIKQLKQWFLKITAYADKLLDDLDQLHGWPERVRTMQANWIGRSRGAEIDFTIIGHNSTKITVFTTRPETLFGVSYVALAPDHPIVDSITDPKHQQSVKSFRDFVSSLSFEDRTTEDKTKQGVPIGAAVLHPLTGDAIPVWIADYVLGDYGYGAVMGVPSHDERDFSFAHRYKLPILPVIQPTDENLCSPNYEEQVWSGPGVLIHSAEFSGMTSDIAKDAIVRCGETKGWARKRVQYRIRDWLISRQRYWGCPIPIVYCDHCGMLPVPKEQLPIKLPKGVRLSGHSGSPLGGQIDWVKTDCPCCGAVAKRETDTMDTFMCSSWYFLRFADPVNLDMPFDLEAIHHWLPVSQYVGGVEHAILHLLYARFLTKALRDRGLVSINEPFERLLTQGMVQGLTYRNSVSGRYVAPTQVIDPDNPRDPDSGESLEVLFEKMSKSKYNGVDPNCVINRYGADTARMFILFKAPPEKNLEWDNADVEGQYRFLQRLRRLICSLHRSRINLKIKASSIKASSALNNNDREIRRAVHSAIYAIDEDLSDKMQFNTAISELMKLSNAITSLLEDAADIVVSEAVSTLIRLLAPFAPHLAEEFWQMLGGEDSVHQQCWPNYDPEALKVESIRIVIQVKGKVRGSINVPIDSDSETVERLALGSEIAHKWLQGSLPSRVIVVPGRLVNLVP
ncbi:leucine--tRNA ligase [cyanobiont of Ornithocercus magnificus]|nr:leucine--tRNA ligase [cyanobiont of Ornithocercus magnificus]